MQINPRVTAAFAILVAAAAGTVAAHYEGYKARAYHDVAHVVTACRGHTGADVQLGRVYSPEQCDKWFQEDMQKAAAGVFRCVRAPMSVNEAAAFADFAYNEGIGTFCKSSMARRANSGDPVGACDALFMYTAVYTYKWDPKKKIRVITGKKILRGLVLRREAERTLCLTPP